MIAIVNKYLNHVSNEQGGGGLLEIGCGKGKTVMALNIISNLNNKNGNRVHKTFLLNQWVRELNNFYPKLKLV